MTSSFDPIVFLKNDYGIDLSLKERNITFKLKEVKEIHERLVKNITKTFWSEILNYEKNIDRGTIKK